MLEIRTQFRFSNDLFQPKTHGRWCISPSSSYALTTQCNSAIFAAKRKPELGGSGQTAMEGTGYIPIIADRTFIARIFPCTYGVAMSLPFRMMVLSDDTLHIMRHRPCAFLILSIIASRAWRAQNESPSGLEAGEAMIGYTDVSGSRDSPGFSRQNFRSTIRWLSSNHYVTIKVTSRGTIAKLSDSRVFDLNLLTGNHQNNQQLTSSQPPANQQVTTNKEGKKKEVRRGENPPNPLFSDSDPEAESAQKIVGLITTQHNVNDPTSSESHPVIPRKQSSREQTPLERTMLLLKRLDNAPHLRAEVGYGVVEIHSDRSSVALQKFHQNDYDSLDKWLTERKL